MADPQTNIEADAAARRTVRNATDEAAPAAREERPFAPAGRLGEENLRAGQDLARNAVETTKEVGERTRQAARELSHDWRGAMEPFVGLQMDMNRWIDDFWRQALGMSGANALRTARPLSMLSPAPLLGLPPMDLRETDKAYVVCAELPGLAREDVDLQIRGEALVISGHKAEAKDDAGSAYRISERRFGRFERSLPIPPDVQRDAIDATFRDGVLTVTLPKTSEAAQRGSKIEIKD